MVGMNVKSIIVFLLSLSIFDGQAQAKPLSLFYKVRQPTVKTENPPILILLHGIGSNEEDLFSFAPSLPGKYLVVSARAPITLSGTSFAWYKMQISGGKIVYEQDQERSSRALLVKFISEIKTKYNLSNSEVYLCGFSQGAIMSYSVALTHPNLVNGIAVMSGRLLEEVKPDIASKAKLKNLKIYIAHGTKDTVLPFQNAVDANAYLQSISLQPTFNQYDEAHIISAEMLKDLVNWLK